MTLIVCVCIYYLMQHWFFCKHAKKGNKRHPPAEMVWDPPLSFKCPQTVRRMCVFECPAQRAGASFL